ncbi:major urinary protein 4-like [Dipodomys merriami]|uniref:major urinary protein 4-like n=1 Tax=Dipodomys merriami TaxID=94247 RepID=UPI0038502760
MKLLLLCLGLALVCAYNEGEMDVVENFDPSKITGKWFTILFASDQKEKIEGNGNMKVFVEYIDLLKNSSLLFKFHTIVSGQCTEGLLAGDKTEKDGVYTAQSDMEYDEYVIFLLKNENNFLLAELYSRQPDVRAEIKENFVEVCEKHGIAEENIVDLTKVGDVCPHPIVLQYGEQILSYFIQLYCRLTVRLYSDNVCESFSNFYEGSSEKLCDLSSKK